MHLEGSDHAHARTLVVLAALLGTAYFVARGAVELAAARWLLAPSATAADGGALERAAFELWRDRRGDGAALLLRDVFDSHLGPMTYDAPPSPVTAPPPRPDDGRRAACAAPMRLVASWVMRARPERSIASLAAGGGPPRLVGPGARIGAHTLVSIGVDRVVLEGPDAGVCEVAMFATPVEPIAPPIAHVSERVVDPAAPPRASARLGRLDEDILPRGAGAWTVRRTLLDELLADPAHLVSLTRVAPHEEGGRVVGMEVLLVPRGGVLSRLGVRVGDVLRTVNGRSLASAEEALAAYTELRAAGRVSLSLLRDGAPVTLDYTIE